MNQSGHSCPFVSYRKRRIPPGLAGLLARMIAPGTGDSAGNDIGERLPSARRDRVSIPTLLKLVASGRIPAEKMGTHSFTFAQIDEAYDVFKNAAENSALKVVITPA